MISKDNIREGLQMEMNKINTSTQIQQYGTQVSKMPADQGTANTKTGEVKEPAKDKVEISQEALNAMANEKTQKEAPASRTSDIVNMSAAERKELVAQMKEEQERNILKMFDFYRETVASQGTTFGKTDDMWKFIASGNYEVDELTKTEAQAAISEDGYYGVKQTSDRIFEFALALTGGDEKQMAKMEKAIADGFKSAEKAWGGDLPSISHETNEAIKAKFQDYYASLTAQGSVDDKELGEV